MRVDSSKVRSGMTGCAGGVSFIGLGLRAQRRRAAKQGLRKGLVILLPRGAQRAPF